MTKFSLPLIALMLVSCSKEAAKEKPERAPQQVTTTTTQTADIALNLSAQGHVSPLDQVEVRPQKSGLIRKVHFKEGDQLSAGQLLFSLDAREDEANVRQAIAKLAQSQAQLAAAERDYTRSKELAAQSFISKTALDNAQSKLETLQATLAAERAAVDAAKVNLSYSQIRAPLSGRAGLVEVHTGSYVQPSIATPLVTISQLDPITVAFSLPERNLGTLQSAPRPILVSASLADGNKLQGKLSFIDNAVNASSGTIALKAEFANPKKQLWPGAFIPVQIAAGTLKNAVILPTQAVQTGPAQRFVFVIQADQTVKSIPVELLQVENEQAVVSGIGSNIKVVKEGGQNLREGSKVREAQKHNASSAQTAASATK
ncbi:efflux RND transporter periplasmic adaptor subunit [Iodobacter ciconiae]|uniref:Efflux RND transporter periplasmic adaptor subunit n=1 Tax=Iodobacter ciconiae TaxID=2496266 RepID=A0A3S8ZNY7_9NEIS|nr:efflux RND transporter periplasmic adaptor subunit [Iodobacter ciconiae]AZN35185.1 efflux RND transporter periplasmic adaptor subunit [Iodobacter ciconiae]